jgi:hypothetical protein
MKKLLANGDKVFKNVSIEEYFSLDTQTVKTKSVATDPAVLFTWIDSVKVFKRCIKELKLAAAAILIFC